MKHASPTKRLASGGCARNIQADCKPGKPCKPSKERLHSDIWTIIIFNLFALPHWRSYLEGLCSSAVPEPWSAFPCSAGAEGKLR